MAKEAQAWLRPHLPALLIYVAIATAVAAPCLLHPTRIALGHPRNDIWNHVWGFWFVAQWIGDISLPVHNPMLAWPRGGSLWFIDSHNAIATLPFQWIFGPVFAYNLSIWGSYIICGIGGYVLALQVTGHRLGALLSGVVVATCPHVLAETYNGISESLSAGWLALSIAAVHAASKKDDMRYTLLAGVAVAVVILANTYYGLMSLMFVGAMAGWSALKYLRRKAVRDAWIAERFEPAARKVVIAGVAAAATAGLPVVLFLWTMGAEDAVVKRDPDFVYWTLILHNMTDLVTLFRPGKFYSPDLTEALGENLIIVVYLGHTLVWPAIGCLVTRIGRLGAPWLALGGFFAILCLGAFLYVDGDYIEVRGGWIPLPFLFLYKYVPPFSSLSHAYRFTIAATVALSVALAWAIRGIQEQGIPVRAAVFVLVAARIGETFFFSPAVFPVPTSDVEIPSAYRVIGEGAVLDLPVSQPVLARARYFVYQIGHGQPTPYVINEPTPPFLALNHYTRYLIEMERNLPLNMPANMPMLDLVVARQQALDSGLRWIVVHDTEYPDDFLPRIHWMLGLTATHVLTEGGVTVYRLDPDEPAVSGEAGEP